jgi:Spx/MgsR family transcriptional regulator
MLIVYGYKACSTCRNAWKWLADNKIPHEARDIISQPPSRAELKACIDQGTPFKKLFNTSGQDYRALGPQRQNQRHDRVRSPRPAHIERQIDQAPLRHRWNEVYRGI